MHRGWAFTLWERSVRWRSTTFVISTPRSSLLSVDYGRNHTSVTFDGEEAYREKVGGFVPFILGPTAPTSLLEGQLSEVEMWFNAAARRCQSPRILKGVPQSPHGCHALWRWSSRTLRQSLYPSKLYLGATIARRGRVASSPLPRPQGRDRAPPSPSHP